VSHFKRESLISNGQVSVALLHHATDASVARRQTRRLDRQTRSREACSAPRQQTRPLVRRQTHPRRLMVHRLNTSKPSDAGTVASSASVVEGTTASDASASLTLVPHLGLRDRHPTQHLSLASHAFVACFSTRNTPATSPLSLMS
jgi:hypothetical protein